MCALSGFRCFQNDLVLFFQVLFGCGFKVSTEYVGCVFIGFHTDNFSFFIRVFGT